MARIWSRIIDELDVKIALKCARFAVAYGAKVSLVVAESRVSGQRASKDQETDIAKEPFNAFLYARDVIKDRWPEAERAISQSEFRDEYLTLFPSAREDWLMSGLLDWLE